MKKLVCPLLLLLTCISTYAQTQFGLTTSGFINKVQVKLVPVPDYQAIGVTGIGAKPGFSAGAFAQKTIRPWLLTRIELNYVNTGYRSREPREDKLTAIATVNYLQLNPMIGLQTKRGFSLSTGPSLNLHVGSSARSAVVLTSTQPASYTVLDEWVHTRGFFNSPPDQNVDSGITERFTLGWQVQAAYTYKRVSIHANRQWHINPMANYMFARSIPGFGRSDVYFSSWQFGLSYALIQKNPKPATNLL